jgi:hypothetical protein
MQVGTKTVDSLKPGTKAKGTKKQGGHNHECAGKGQKEEYFPHMSKSFIL